MKNFLILVIVGILILGSLGSGTSNIFLSYNAAAESEITVTTNKPNYHSGETLTLEWTIPEGSTGSVSVVFILNPNGNVVIIDQNSGTTAQFFIGGALWALEGEYIALVQHGTFSGQTSFIVSDSAIGGEMIPLDTTMVLVAGTQTAAAWILPVIVAGAGFAIVIARKF